MNNIPQIEQLIYEMLSDGQNRMEAEKIYTEMIERSPFDITNYHIQYILQNLQNNSALQRGFTLLYQILNNSTVYSKYSPDQNIFIQTKLLELLVTPNFDEYNRNYLLDIIEVAQKNYNSAHLIENSNFGWPSIFQFCFNIALSDDKTFSYLGIELISRFVKYGTLKVQDNIQLIHQIIQKIFTSTDIFLPQINSTVNLIVECFSDDITLKQYAPNVIQYIQITLPNLSKPLIVSVNRISINFFSETLLQLINTISSILANKLYPIDIRYYILDIILSITHNEKLAEFCKTPEFYIPVMQSMSVVFSNFESEEDLSFIKQTNMALEAMDKVLDSNQLDDYCLTISTNFMANENCKLRFAGLYIFNSILKFIEDSKIVQIAPFVLKLIKDPSNVCRRTVYKILKRISSKRGEVFISELQQYFFPTLFESITTEPSPEIVIYAFKVLSQFCEDRGSEVLEQYCDSILKLCLIYSKENSIPLQVSIIDCIKNLCQSMMMHLNPSYPLISQYISQMANHEIPAIRYSVICAIPQMCKIIPQSSAEQIKVAEFGLNLFMQTNIQQLYSEQEQLDLFKSFRKLTKIIGCKNIKIFQMVVVSLIQIASETVELQVVKDNFDESILPRNTIILRFDNIDHCILLYSNEKCREIDNAFYNLNKLIERFPEQFIPITDQLLKIIDHSFQQYALNFYYRAHKKNYSTYCLRTMIEKADKLNVSYQAFLQIFEKFPDLMKTREKLVFLENLVAKFNDPNLVQQSINIAIQYLQEVKIKLNEYNEHFNKIKNDPNSEDEQETVMKFYNSERKNHYSIARFFSFVIENYPTILNDQFILILHQMFQDEKNVLPYLIVETEIQVMTNKHFKPILENCCKYIDSYGKECLFTLELIEKIIKASENQEILTMSYGLIMKVLTFDDDVFDEYPDLSTISVNCLVLLYQKFPPSINENSLHLFIMFLPVQDSNCKNTHLCFAKILQQSPAFFTNENNIEQTFYIIAKTCEGRQIDIETKTIFRFFMKSIISQEPQNTLVTNSLNKLKKCHIDRLRKFVNETD